MKQLLLLLACGLCMLALVSAQDLPRPSIFPVDFDDDDDTADDAEILFERSNVGIVAVVLATIMWAFWRIEWESSIERAAMTANRLADVRGRASMRWLLFDNWTMRIIEIIFGLIFIVGASIFVTQSMRQFTPVDENDNDAGGIAGTSVEIDGDDTLWVAIVFAMYGSYFLHRLSNAALFNMASFGMAALWALLAWVGYTVTNILLIIELVDDEPGQSMWEETVALILFILLWLYAIYVLIKALLYYFAKGASASEQSETSSKFGNSKRG